VVRNRSVLPFMVPSRSSANAAGAGMAARAYAVAGELAEIAWVLPWTGGVRLR
jgi:hypothetical protein